MDKYRYSDEEQKLLESSAIPFAVYQFIDKRVVTIALSEGFMQLIGARDLAEAYDLMDNDLSFIGDAAYRFATEGGEYDVVYRTKKDGEYRIIHANGKHVYKEDGIRLAFVWYTDCGAFKETQQGKGNIDHLHFP